MIKVKSDIIFAFITLSAFGLGYFLTRALFHDKAVNRFAELSYAFLPFSLSVYLAENTFRLLKGIFFILSKIGELFGKVWEFAVDFETINHIQLVLLWTGFLFTIWAGYVISKTVNRV